MNTYREKRGSEAASLGEIVLSGQVLEAAGHTELRDLHPVLPWGMDCSPSEGSETVLLPVEGGDYLLLGSIRRETALKPGEVELRSSGGAYLRLRQDGCAEINGLVITAEGELVPPAARGDGNG